MSLQTFRNNIYRHWYSSKQLGFFCGKSSGKMVIALLNFGFGLRSSTLSKIVGSPSNEGKTRFEVDKVSYGRPDLLHFGKF